MKRIQNVVQFIIFTSIIFVVKPVYAQMFSCEELRPIRAIGLSSQGMLEAGAGLLRGKILGGSIEVDGELSYREEFPDLYVDSSIASVERFYYMLCLALSDESIPAETRFHWFLQAETQRSNEIDAAFSESVNSDRPEQQIAAIEYGEQIGGSKAQIAIAEGLASNDHAVQTKAVAASFALSKVVGGVIFGINNKHFSAFNLYIENVEENAAGANIKGTLDSGVFEDRSERIPFEGTVKGGSISITADDCSLTFWKQESLEFEGNISCKKAFKVHGNRYESRRIWMKIT